MKDFEIRNLLHNNYLTEYNNYPESFVVDELKVCNGLAIMDVAVVNGSLIGYEIKSSCDTLARLDKQVSYYNRVFDFITIVANSKHIDNLIKDIPLWWGIWLIDTKGHKTELRTSSLNVNVDAFSIAQFLWKDELIDLIIRRNLEIKMKNKRRWLIWEYISENIDLDELKNEVRYYLKARRNWKKSSFMSI